MIRTGGATREGGPACTAAGQARPRHRDSLRRRLAPDTLNIRVCNSSWCALYTSQPDAPYARSCSSNPVIRLSTTNGRRRERGRGGSGERGKPERINQSFHASRLAANSTTRAQQHTLRHTTPMSTECMPTSIQLHDGASGFTDPNARVVRLPGRGHQERRHHRCRPGPASHAAQRQTHSPHG